MRFRGLALYPLVYAVVFVAVAAWLGSGDSTPSPDPTASFVLGQKLLLRVLAVIGSLAAMLAFERADHLRRAWSGLVTASIAVLVRDLLGLAGVAGWVVSGLGVLSNVALLVGVLLLAIAWKKADIPLPGGRSGAILVGVLGAVLALAVAGPAAYRQGILLFGGDWTALVLFVSAVVDILALCLLAPLLLTAISLRGGLFAWPWALITASILSWLLYDAAASRSFHEFYGFDPALWLPAAIPLAEVFRGLALNYQFSAGLAQRFAVQQVRKASR